MMTFGSHLRATIFQAERPLSIKACWFKRNIPVTSPPPPSFRRHPPISLARNSVTLDTKFWK